MAIPVSPGDTVYTGGFTESGHYVDVPAEVLAVTPREGQLPLVKVVIEGMGEIDTPFSMLPTPYQAYPFPHPSAVPYDPAVQGAIVLPEDDKGSDPAPPSPGGEKAHLVHYEDVTDVKALFPEQEVWPGNVDAGLDHAFRLIRGVEDRVEALEAVEALS